ncbi:hypothetical protein DFR33_105151 [Bradymonas sediminis]|nr:hypothetical protein DFR33_105151 [Bradymonas sediminis]
MEMYNYHIELGLFVAAGYLHPMLAAPIIAAFMTFGVL